MPQDTSTSPIPARYLATLASMMEKAGIDASATLANLDIDLSELSPGQSVPAKAYGELYQQYVSAMQSKYFGFPSQLGENLGRYRMLFLLMVNCPTLGIALNRIAEFCDAFGISERMLYLHDIDEETVAVEFNVQMQSIYRNNSQGAVISANLMASQYRIACWLTGQPLPLKRVQLACASPENSAPYEKLFSCPVEFSAGKDALVLDRSALDFPIVHTEEALPQVMEHWPAALFVDPSEISQDLVHRIERLIGDNLAREYPKTDELAKRLGLSSRELRTELKNRGLTLKQIIDGIRQGKAEQLLIETDLELSRIAEQLGFPAVSAFHRSFKRWTGKTPGAFRAGAKQLKVEN